jgi:hypothetical protein
MVVNKTAELAFDHFIAKKCRATVLCDPAAMLHLETEVAASPRNLLSKPN